MLESLFNKRLKACNFIKKMLQPKCFAVNIAKFVRTSILKNICERLLLCFNMEIYFLDGFSSYKNHEPEIKLGLHGRKKSEFFVTFILSEGIFLTFLFYLSVYRSSHRRHSVKKCGLKQFVIFTGKHLCWSLFFNKLQECPLDILVQLIVQGSTIYCSKICCVM